MIGVFMGMTVKGDIQLFLTQSAAKKEIPAEIWNKKTCTHLQLLKNVRMLSQAWSEHC